MTSNVHKSSSSDCFIDAAIKAPHGHQEHLLQRSDDWPSPPRGRRRAYWRLKDHLNYFHVKTRKGKNCCANSTGRRSSCVSKVCNIQRTSCWNDLGCICGARHSPAGKVASGLVTCIRKDTSALATWTRFWASSRGSFRQNHLSLQLWIWNRKNEKNELREFNKTQSWKPQSSRINFVI